MDCAMAENERKIRNCSIDIFRYICAIMVVMIHTQPFSDIDDRAGYIFAQIVPRIAVPFFFAAAGYFYIPKLEKGQKPFFPYIKRLLAGYSVWSLLYYIVDFKGWGHSDIKNFVVSCAYQFIVTGSHGHFWFFTALIFAVCFTTLLFMAGGRRILIPLSVVLYAIGCIGCAYYELGIRIPVLGELFLLPQFNLVRRDLFMGVPFFACGYLVSRIQGWAESKVSDRRLYCLAGLAIVVWLAEIQLVRVMEWETNIILTFGLYPLVVIALLILLRNPLPAYDDFSGRCSALAEFTYYSHPFCIQCLSWLGYRLLQREITATPMFFLTIAATATVGFLIDSCKRQRASR